MSEQEKHNRLEREIAETIGDKKLRALSDVLVQTDAEWQAPSDAKIVRFSFIKKLGAAAAILMVGLAAWWILINPAISEQDLFAAHYTPYAMVLTQRSDTAVDSELLQQAIANYSNQNYPLATTQFATLAQQQPEQPLYRLYECVAQLGVAASANNVACFSELQQYPRLREQATWYLGLTYLQLEKIEAAKTVFHGIESGQFKNAAAEEILQQLQ
ncbi:MAG: hypothetical protein AB8G22_17845 [Saprospiraceae bacterium]